MSSASPRLFRKTAREFVRKTATPLRLSVRHRRLYVAAFGCGGSIRSLPTDFRQPDLTRGVASLPARQGGGKRMSWVALMYVAAVAGSVFGVFWPFIVRLFRQNAPDDFY